MVEELPEMWVVGRTQIAPYTEENKSATGVRLRLDDALTQYGREILEEAVERGSAIVKGNSQFAAFYIQGQLVRSHPLPYRWDELLARATLHWLKVAYEAGRDDARMERDAERNQE